MIDDGGDKGDDAPPVLHHVKATVEFDDDEDDVVFIGRKVQRRKW